MPFSGNSASLGRRLNKAEYYPSEYSQSGSVTSVNLTDSLSGNGSASLIETDTETSSRLSIHVVDRNTARRARMAGLVFSAGHHAEVYADDTELLAYAPKGGLVLAYDDPAHGGVVALMERMAQRGHWLPVIAMADEPEVAVVVDVIKAGAIDYMVCPKDVAALLATVGAAAKDASSALARRTRAAEARQRIARLSAREREVLELVWEGCSNKEIARRLDISPRTVEIHRMKMMGKLGLKRSSEAVRLRIEAVGHDQWLQAVSPSAVAA